MLTRDQIGIVLSGYWNLSECIKTHDIDEIVYSVADLLKVDAEKLAVFPMGGYSKGRLSGAYYFILQDFKKNIDSYDWLYERLYDDESRSVFHNLMLYRFIPDKGFIERAYDSDHPQYFDTDFVHCDENEVFVDCGGFIGDTILSFNDVYGAYKKCYIYEPDENNITKIQENLKGLHDINIRNAGVGDHTEIVRFSGHQNSGSFLKDSEDGVEAALVSLDDDIDEPVSFIKMDIEGFEIPAILGAKNHIVDDQPKLAICLYHILSDLWEIPRIIDTLCPNHKFYLRHYEKTENWETVLYAIPENKHGLGNPLKTAVTIMPYERPWSNVELIKDCGLVPFLLHKNHGMEVTMIGTSGKNEDYPYSQYVDGMNLLALEDHKLETKLRYLKDHSKEIDLLILRGPYGSCIRMTEIYKHYNPDGLVYCGLDANSWWMDRINWYEADFSWFIENCDIMATSCTAMAEMLSHKWHRKIELVTNGYCDLDGILARELPFNEKENIILTVGRLGTQQKATDVMLLAFAYIADKVPGWKLRLVGGVENSFTPFVEEFFATYPELKDRVEFAGQISDRTRLNDEYAKAKIFALSSVVEGGPNVIAEALRMGCVTAVTKFDAWDDSIDKGKCGAAAEIGDVEGFASCLLKLCTDPELEQKSRHAREYAHMFFDMEKNVAHLYEMLSERRNER